MPFSNRKLKQSRCSHHHVILYSENHYRNTIRIFFNICGHILISETKVRGSTVASNNFALPPYCFYWLCTFSFSGTYCIHLHATSTRAARRNKCMIGPSSWEISVIPPPSGLRNCNVCTYLINLSVSFSENPPYASRVVTCEWTGVTKQYDRFGDLVKAHTCD